MRRFTPVELAIGVALLGSLLAVAVPAFSRDLHSSRLVEPIDGLGAHRRRGRDATRRRTSASPTARRSRPPIPPRGIKEADQPGTWDGPTWKDLAFRPSPEGVPHAYSFSFESTAGGSGLRRAGTRRPRR